MIVAVTGGTGFVGRHLLAKLEKAGLEVRVLARTPEKLPKTGTLAVVQGDITDCHALAHLCRGAHVVVHVAGAISGTPAQMTRVNAEATRRLIDVAGGEGVRRLVHLSSLAAREPHLSPYGHSKAKGEAAVKAAGRGLSTLIIRPPAVYGEGDTATLPLLKALTSRTAILPGSATARFSLIHAEDLASICLSAIGSPVEGLREVDDGHGAYDWNEVVQILHAVCGRPFGLKFLPRPLAMAVGHAADGLAALTRRPGMVSAGKMHELYHPDWVARPPGWPRDHAIPLAEGMRRTLAWAMAQGLLPQLPLADRSAAS